MRKLLRHKLEFLHAADSGQTLVLIALGLMMFLMVAALGVDVGYLHYQQEQLQKAADAGAIAAATALSYNGEWMDAGLNDVAANGFSNGVGGVTVTINNPPAAPDPFAGNSNYVQVIVTKPIPTFFMRIAGRYSVNVTSRAVANAAGNASACIWVLDPTDSGSLLLDGNVNLNASCGIRIESDSPSALTKHGNSGSITVGGVLGSIGIVGRCSGCDSNVTPTPVTGIPKFNDPLGSVPAPVNPYTCGSAPQNPPSGYVYQPSCYYGISVPANGTYTFKQGTYFLLGGGLSIGGNSTVTGSNVTFYLTWNTSHPYLGISLAGGPGVNLSAPTTGPLKGILFFQDRSVAVNTATSSFDGSAGATFTGALYFPTTTVQFKGNPNLAASSPIVAYELEFKGDASIQDNFLPLFGSPIPGATLVE